MVPTSGFVAPLAALTLGALSLSPAALPGGRPATPAVVAALRPEVAGARVVAQAGTDGGSRAGAPPHSPKAPRIASPAAAATRAHGAWQWPLVPQPAVRRLFAAPRSRYGPGHRGVDLAGRSGQRVLAVDSGTVSHVGVIAGRGTVTVLHASGLRSTYEPVDASVVVGAAVARGQPVGTLTADASHCAPDSCLHLGALRDRTYLDPLELLGRRGVRLLPLP